MRQEILDGAWSEERQCVHLGFRQSRPRCHRAAAAGARACCRPPIRASSRRWSASRKSCASGDLLFRYKHADDFGTPENAFTICAFWYVNALAAAGRVDEARERFTRLLERAQSARPAVRRHRARERRAVGQFSADLQHGGSHRQRTAAVAQLGGDRMSRLVAVSNRISVPKRGAAPGGLAVGLLAAMQARRGMWFGWDGETAEIAARRTVGGAQGWRHLRVDRLRPGRVPAISISASATARCGRCSTISWTASVTTTRSTRPTSA